MLDQTTIDRYLEEIDSYLHIDRDRRERVLTEIEGHLRDALEAHTARGLSADEAMRRAIAALGSPADVARQFSPVLPPARSVRGWRRWAPIVLPGAVLTAVVALSVWSLIYLLRYGSTLGGRIALRFSLLYLVLTGALTAATYVAIRNGDRDPAWRRGAWLLAALTGGVVAVRYAA